MAKFKKLSEILGSKSGVDLQFVGLQTDETSRGLPIVRLILKENLPVVYGRQISDNVTGDRVRLEANDVEMVSIGADILAEIEKMETAELEKPEAERKMPFTWTEEGVSGTLKLPELKLDVAASQEVWVANKEGFAGFAAKKRNERQQSQRSSLVAKIRDAKTKKEFAGTDVKNILPPVPTPVS
jgi:hypothetical protein